MGSTQKEKENEAIYTQIEMDLLLEQIKEDERKEAMQNHLDAEAKKRDSKAGMNKGGMPKKDFAKPGSYSSAYNKGGMGKAKTGHTDYRKGGMVYGSKK